MTTVLNDSTAIRIFALVGISSNTAQFKDCSMLPFVDADARKQ